MNFIFSFLSKWRNLLFLFGLFLLANFLLSQFMPKEQALDLKFAYSAEEAYQALSELDETEQSNYKFGLLALDMPYLLVYGLFFSGILLKLYSSKKIVGIPLAIMAMDFFENLLVVRLLQAFPIENRQLATMASIFSTSKWVLIAVMGFVILMGLTFLLFKRRLADRKIRNSKI